MRRNSFQIRLFFSPFGFHQISVRLSFFHPGTGNLFIFLIISYILSYKKNGNPLMFIFLVVTFNIHNTYFIILLSFTILTTNFHSNLFIFIVFLFFFSYNMKCKWVNVSLIQIRFWILLSKMNDAYAVRPH